MTINELVGKTLVKIIGTKDDPSMDFHTTDGEVYGLEHDQDCCEQVYLEDIVGDIDDLIGSPILAADEVSDVTEPDTPDNADCYEWTFYRISTIKGTVVLRWFGTSNGHYSTRVDFRKIK